MKKYHELNVTEFVTGLQATWYDGLLDQLAIVDESYSEYSILSFLDRARKCFDVQLATFPEELNPLECVIKRILYGSLRKYSQPIRLDGVWVSDAPSQIEDLSVSVHDEHRLVDVKTLSWASYSTLLERNAIEGFIQRNEQVRLSPPPYLINGMRSFLAAALNGFDRNMFNSEGHFGPGAVEERLTIFERWDLLGKNPHWEPTLEDYTVYDLPSSTEVRLCAVDKDWNKKRLITVEPYESTYLQHKIRHALSRTLVHNGLGKLASQSDSHIDIPAEHRRLCLESSAYARQTARIDSFDLSDASDSISWEAVIAVFPVDVVRELERARTPYYTYMTSTNKGLVREVTPMQIYAGMGNATTFLVEGLYFYALLQAAAEYHRVPNRKARDISVFGDDLITPTGYHSEFMTAIENAGLKLNRSKSFWGTCEVRESCGMWAWRGHNLYALPFRGYPKSPEGALGFSEYIRNSTIVTRDLCLGYVKDWPNTDQDVPNTISVVDASRPVNWELSRWSSKLCGTEWLLKAPQSSHRFHLCVRRGGAYMMISRIPSQEGITETVPLLEVLSQRYPYVDALIGKIVEVRVKPPRKRNPVRERSEDRSQTDSNGIREVIVTQGLIELCRFVAWYKTQAHQRTVSRAFLRLLNLRSKVVKPRTKEEREALSGFRSKLSASRSNIPSLSCSLLGTVGVIKEAIPYSTTLRSSWVSIT